MTREELALEVIGRLGKEYPDAGCTLDCGHVWKLPVSVRLAAQCTDARVNMVVEDLYAKYPDVNALTETDAEDIERVVKSCDPEHSKARDISVCMKILKEQYEDKVPDDLNAPLRLPGMGRKSADLVMGDMSGKSTIMTDTHCIRLMNRMGLAGGIKGPKKMGVVLWKLVPSEEGSDLCHRLVFRGRGICTTGTEPRCKSCRLNDICKKAGVG